MMRLSDAGRDAIIQREGLRLTAYTCPAGKLTIGIGHTGPDVKRGLRITEARAYDLLARDIAPAENLLNGLGVKFTQGQFDALLSFILNIGITSFKKSTMLMHIRVGAPAERIAGEFLRWVYITGPDGRKIQSKGLTARRRAERRQFLGV